jgi:aminoglycoside phosphotransferase (APT) family kinase protein
MSELPGLDAAGVSAWLAERRLATPPLTFELFTGGHSNFTYGIDDADGRRLVLRRPPLGSLGGGGHDVLREHRIISALGPTEAPVPPTVATCDDHAVTGADFYVMSRVEGHVVATPEDAATMLPDPDARRQAGESLIDALVALHRVDVDTVGLGDLARRENFAARQISRFDGMWQRTRTREVPLLDGLADRFASSIPPESRIGVVHGDYRMGNVITRPDGTVAAILDWELCTLGDVRADLGYLLNNWQEPEDGWPALFMVIPPTVAGGFISRDDALARYLAGVGDVISPADVDWFRAFSYWRFAVIAEGVKRRYESVLDQRVTHLAEFADAHLRAALAG